MSTIENSLRPTKKQRELLSFIESFITEHGYSPSYREIMNGLQYTSVATVALHVTSLIKRGHLRKRDRSARSLEVVATQEAANDLADPNIQLVSMIEAHIAAEAKGKAPVNLQEASTLVEALRILGLSAAADRLAIQVEKLAA